MSRIRTIILKEWEEVFKNGLVLFTMIFTPLFFVAMGVGMVVTTNKASQAAGDRDAQEIAQLAGEMCTGLSGVDCVTVYMATMMLLLFMMLPIILPTVFASYSIVGEKSSRTLEPLLATPITTTELLVGKMAAAVLPAVLVTWVGVALYLAIVAPLSSPAVMDALLSPAWLVAVGLLGPLLAILGVNGAIIISSRVTDPRTAQQLSGVLVMPMVLVLTGQSLGWLIVDDTLVGLGVLATLVIDLVLTWVAVELFDREQVLTRWK